MFAGWLTNAMPGLRELRPTFASGLLWSFFLLVAGHETVANADRADGLVGDLHTIAARSDPLVVALVLGTVVFTLGAVTFSAVEWLARQLGNATESLARIRTWKNHADQVLSQLENQISTNQFALANLNYESQDTEDQKSAVRRKRGQYGSLIKSAERRLNAVHYFPGFGKATKIPKWLSIRFPWRVRRTVSNIGIIGDVPPRPGSGLEIQIISEAALESAEATLRQANDLTPLSDVNYLSQLEQDWVLRQAADRLSEEVRTNPTELLRVYSPEAYLQYDKEVVEAKLRVAVAAPATSLGIALSAETRWALLLFLLGSLQFISSSFHLAQETRLILDTVKFRGLKTPAVVAAQRRGRELAYEYLRSKAEFSMSPATSEVAGQSSQSQK